MSKIGSGKIAMQRQREKERKETDRKLKKDMKDLSGCLNGCFNGCCLVPFSCKKKKAGKIRRKRR